MLDYKSNQDDQNGSSSKPEVINSNCYGEKLSIRPILILIFVFTRILIQNIINIRQVVVQIEVIHQVDLKLKKITSKDNWRFVVCSINIYFDYCYSEEEVADEQEPEGEDLNSEDVNFKYLVYYLQTKLLFICKEYEDEDELEHDQPDKKKKKNERFGGFIIDEAEVDDDVEDDDDWEDGFGEFDIIGNAVDELGPTAREIEGRRRGTNIWE